MVQKPSSELGILLDKRCCVRYIYIIFVYYSRSRDPAHTCAVWTVKPYLNPVAATDTLSDFMREVMSWPYACIERYVFSLWGCEHETTTLCHMFACFT